MGDDDSGNLIGLIRAIGVSCVLTLAGFGTTLVFIFYKPLPFSDEDRRAWMNLLFGLCISLSMFIAAWYYRKRDRKARGLEWLPEMWRPKLRPGSYASNESCVVLHRIDPGEYSQMAAEIGARPHVTSVFSVCGYEPIEFLEHAASQQSTQTVESVTDADLNAAFPHFRGFDDIAAKPGKAVTRVVLINGEQTEWLRRNEPYIERFNAICGSRVLNYIAESSTLRGQGHDLRYLTDHVVFNNEFCIDYYHDSHTAIITLIDGDGACEEILQLPRDFTRWSLTGNTYMPLKDFIARIKKTTP